MNTRKIGVQGEVIAREYLKKKGYTILKENFRCPLGEIDLIVSRGNLVVFVEVKSRENEKFGRPIESITTYKANTIRRCASFYQAHLGKKNEEYRFDVVEVLRGEVSHIEDAF